MTETFRITIPECPFSGRPIVLVAPGEPTKPGYRGPLTNNELLLLAAAVPNLNLFRLEIALRQAYHFGDDRIKELTWDEIQICCQRLIDAQNQPPKTATQKIKAPSEVDRIAYQLTRVYGLKGQDAAEMMYKEGLRNKKGGLIGQWDVSRWAAAYAAWLEQQGLPTEQAAPKAGKHVANVAAFAAGARTDGRKPHKKPEK